MRAATPAVMIQGVCSNAGKSLLTAALCRIFARRGLNPAPFKAQNMALNSFVTEDGREIGRAQALQAAACGRAPDARMNPVLLKPSSDTGSQVLIMGRPMGHMQVREYLAYKPQAWRAATEAYDSLAREAGVMVIEGAGSPAEINLKAHDIVNMAMARHAGAPVLLIADIDRGGAFAALAGTMLLLDEDDRRRVAGFVLNKFRGDAGLLRPAMEEIRKLAGAPFLGVAPWIEGLNLPEEDSVSFRLYGPGLAPGGECSSPGMALDVALTDLARISNITDVDCLRGEPDVRLRLLREPADLELSMPDLIILPGSKNTPGDLRALRESGLADAIIRAARRPDGPMVLGVCGGLQMLGLRICDPLGVEGGGAQEEEGLGLLPLVTRMGREKTLRRATAVHVPSGLPTTGYEIHHGVTDAVGETRVVLETDDRPLGWSDADGRVWGTYLHGVLDDDAFRRHVLNSLRRRKGLPELSRGAPYSLSADLDRLADVIENSLDMAAIYAMLSPLSPDIKGGKRS